MGILKKLLQKEKANKNYEKKTNEENIECIEKLKKWISDEQNKTLINEDASLSRNVKKIIDKGKVEENIKKEVIEKIEKYEENHRIKNQMLTKAITNKKENEIKNTNVNKIISMLDELKIEEFEYTDEYEEFSKSSGYIFYSKIVEVIELLNEYDIKDDIVNSLEAITKTLKKEMDLCLSKVETLYADVTNLRQDVKKFVTLINSCKSQGKIEYKRQHEKLVRVQGNLTSKRSELLKEEEKVKSKISKINDKIKNIVEEFMKIEEVLQISLKEKQLVLENLVLEYEEEILKQKSYKNQSEEKESVEKLKELKKIVNS